MRKVVYIVQIQHRECRKLLTNGQRLQYYLAEAYSWFIHIKFYHRANKRGKYADGSYNSMIDNKDGHIPSPLIMFTCIALRHALTQLQTNKGVHLKDSKSLPNVDRPDRLNFFNYMNGSGRNACCCAATGRKLLTSPDVGDTYTFLKNTWNTLPESYQRSVHNITLSTVKHQIQQVENTKIPMVISVEAARVDNAILLEYLTSEVAVEEPVIRGTDRNIPMDNICTDDELPLGISGGNRNYENDCDESDVGDAIPTASRQ
jgi:hypothetical protein